MPTLKDHRDWFTFTFGKPMVEPTPPIMLPPTLYARAKERGADMRGYQMATTHQGATTLPPIPE